MKPTNETTAAHTPAMGLEYIANSPDQISGGFHPFTVSIAREAIIERERLVALLQDGALQLGRLTGPNLETYARSFAALAGVAIARAKGDASMNADNTAALLVAFESLLAASTKFCVGCHCQTAKADDALSVELDQARAAIAKAKGQS